MSPDELTDALSFGAQIIRENFAGISLAGRRLPDGMLIECDLTGVDFSGANIAGLYLDAVPRQLH